MAADEDHSRGPVDLAVAQGGSRPEAIADHAESAAPRLAPVYVRLREILHRTRAGSSAEPSPMLPGMEAY